MEEGRKGVDGGRRVRGGEEGRRGEDVGGGGYGGEEGRRSRDSKQSEPPSLMKANAGKTVFVRGWLAGPWKVFCFYFCFILDKGPFMV